VEWVTYISVNVSRGVLLLVFGASVWSGSLMLVLMCQVGYFY